MGRKSKDTVERNLNNRTKVNLGFGLLLLIVLLMVANKFEEDNLAAIDHSFDSIFKDRLVPATSIFDLRENLYQKRVILERAVRNHSDDGGRVREMIVHCNRRMDSLLANYRETFFIEKEYDYLHELERDLTQYEVLEAQVLTRIEQGDREGAAAIFTAAGMQFDDAVVQLSNLNHIQSEIGEGLVVDEKGNVASAKVLFRLETGLILLIALILQVLIRSSFAARKPSIDQFHLN